MLLAKQKAGENQCAIRRAPWTNLTSPPPPLAHWLHLALALAVIGPAGCTFDLNTEYHSLTGGGDLMVTSDDPEPFHATARLESAEDYDEDPMPRTLTLDLSAKGRDMKGTLVLELDKGPSKVGRREVKSARLKLKGHPEIVLPAKGWTWAGAFEVRWMQEYKLPSKDNRSCQDRYPTRSARVFLSLQATGPAGQGYTVHPAELDLEWTFVCKEFHM